MPIVTGFGQGVIHAALPSQRIFSPLSISGLQLWLSSRYASSMLQERSSATTLASANGDPIGTWQDLSGNARHVTTPTSDTKRPTLGTSSQNGLPGVVFDGTDDAMARSFGLLASVSSYSLFMVFRSNTLAGSAACVLANNGNLFSGYRTSGNQIRSYPSSAAYAASTLSYSDDAAYIFCDKFDGSGSGNAGRFSRFKNGAAETLTFAGTVPATTAAATAFNIGGTSDTGNLWKGQIYEILAYTPVLSDGQRQQVERYLGAAWGITLS